MLSHLLHSLLLRSVLAALSAFLIMLFLGKPTIALLQKLQMEQVIRTVGPKSHLKKAGTPTMGGCLMIIAIVIAVLLFSNLSTLTVWLVLIATIGFSAIGFSDDYLKVILKNNRGLRSRWKYFWQSVLGLVCAILFAVVLHTDNSLTIPFARLALPMGLWSIVLYYFVIVGSSNAVNLTDGLDGLVSIPVLLVALGLGIFAYLSAQPSMSEMTVICGAIAGACLGFLWFNAYPAQMFMGDVGALALGAALGLIAIVIHQEIILAIMGGIFVLETLSVILQVGSFRLRKGKRIFKMAPIHHHFELAGLPETQVVIRFWIVTAILVVIGLLSLVYS